MPKRTTRRPFRHVLKTKQAHTHEVWKFLCDHLGQVLQNYNELVTESEALEEFFVDVKCTPRTVVFEIHREFRCNLLSGAVERTFYQKDGLAFLDVVGIPYWS